MPSIHVTQFAPLMMFVGGCLTLRSQNLVSPNPLEVDNSSAFNEYRSPYTLSKYVEEYKKANKPAPVIVSHPIPTHADGSVPGLNSIYPSQDLVDISWRSSLIVVVRFTQQKTLVLDDRSFLFTNFEAAIEDVLKDESGKFVAGDEVLITRAGGEETNDGMLIKAIDPEFRPFKDGTSYLLFLNQVPATTFYKAIAPRSFELASSSEGEVKPMDALPLRPLAETGSRQNSQFLEEVREAIITAVRQQKEPRRTQ